MTRVAFQVFLTRSERKSFNTSLVEKVRSDYLLSFCFQLGCVVSFSKDKAGAFQAQFLGVILGRKFLAVSHASS